jgi:uroporphyrinogen-III synthase
VMSVGTSDATEALGLAAKAGYRRLLWLAGEDHRSLEPEPDLTVDTIVCYASDPINLPGNAAKLIMDAGAVALHSPLAAKAFADTTEALDLDRSSITLAAFSSMIAEAAGTGWRAVAIASAPSDSAMLSALTSLDTLPPRKAKSEDGL